MEDTRLEIPEFWFERASERIHLPLWAGAVVLGIVPFVLLGFVSGLLLPEQPQVPIPGGFWLYVLVLSIFTFFESSVIFYTARYLRVEISDLLNYARKLEIDSPREGTELNLAHLSSTTRIIFAYVLVVLFTVPLFTLGQPGPIIDNVIGEIPFAWGNFLLATFFWAFGYSMYSIYKMGKLPMKLKPYTQDRTLGLKPFATASLNSTLIYFGFVTVLVLLVTFGGALPVDLALTFAGLYPIGLVLFLLPLRSLHAKLVEEKARKTAWLEPRATAIMEKLESEKGIQIDQATSAELTAIDKIQKDIQQIRSWPFDTGIIGRLLAILISVSAILLSAYIKNVLPGLH